MTTFVPEVHPAMIMPSVYEAGHVTISPPPKKYFTVFLIGAQLNYH